jgi:hypothetical protein
MRVWTGLLAVTLLPAADLPLEQILSRVSEEAEVFRQVAPQTLAEETLTQRTLKPPPRFRPRLGAAAKKPEPPKPVYATQEVVSEYSFATLRDSPGALHEFRQVISVNGRRITTPEKARHALSLGLRSEDDRVRKRMLEEFQKHGLQGAATDFGQLILLFTRRELQNYEFRIEGPARIGAEEALMIAFEQRQGENQTSLLVFEGRKTVRGKIEGRLWVRRRDGLPLRILMRSEWTVQGRARRHEGIVEYTPAPFGAVAPASVKHSEYVDDQLVTENLFRYSAFKKFGADAEIKFQTLPEADRK